MGKGIHTELQLFVIPMPELQSELRFCCAGCFSNNSMSVYDAGLALNSNGQGLRCTDILRKAAARRKRIPLPYEKTSIFSKSTSQMPGVRHGHPCGHVSLSLSQHTQVTMKKNGCFSGVAFFLTVYCLYGN